MKRTKSQLNANNDRVERRRTAAKAIYGWLNPETDISAGAAIWLKNAIEGGFAGEFVTTCNGYREKRRPITWEAVSHCVPWTWHYCEFELYRAAVRAKKSVYYRRRLAELGIDWRFVKRPFGTEEIELD